MLPSKLMAFRLAIGCLFFSLFLLLSFGLAAEDAHAHAYLDRAIPAQEAELEQSPVVLLVEFTEPINTRLSRLRLEHEDGRMVNDVPLAEGSRSLRLNLPELEPGVYSVYWQVLSLDTHVTDGAYRFAIGIPLPALTPDDTIDLDAAIDAPGYEQNRPISSQIGVFARVLDVLLISLLAGWLCFRIIFWPGAGDTFIRGNELADRRNQPLQLHRLAIYVGLGFILTGVLHLLARAIPLSSASLFDPALWSVIGYMTMTTTFGLAAWLRPLAALLIAYLLLRQFEWGRPYIIMLLLGLVISLSWTGHAAHSGQWISQSLHVIAGIIWFGGLLGFAVQSFRLQAEGEALYYLHQRIKHFSHVALASILVIAASGVVLTLSYMDQGSQLVESQYGLTLLVKIGLFLTALVVAAFHRFVWLPNLQKALQVNEKLQDFRALLWGIRLQLIIVIAAFVAAALLASTSPPVDIHQHHHLH